MRGERRRPTPHLGDRLHARNRYKHNAPDFYALGRQYPSFAQYLRNVNDDKKTAALAFDDPYAVRELTRTLLLRDFGLDWTMPIDRLCPPLPNRLNYIHWIEDLLHASGVDPFGSSGETPVAVRGIDVGTGASCIYALLGAQMNGWSFLATDIDKVSHEAALDNVTRNKMRNQVYVLRVATTNLLLEPLEDAPSRFQGEQIHFSMCNPPFFNDMSEADTNPDAACMGNASEMVCPGGEVAFIGHMIEDSLKLRDRVMVYTSMIGRKASLRKILAVLREKGIHNVCSIEFFQGLTKRWGIAWSYVESVPLKDQAKVLGKRKETQRQQDVEFHVPFWSREAEHGCDSVQEVIDRISEYTHSVRDFDVEFTVLDSANSVYSLVCTALDKKDEPPVFEATVEIDTDKDSSAHVVLIEYDSGKRDACWRFCESLKAATIRSGRQWRRKRHKPATTNT